jgi:hypothetical protein
MCTGVCLYKYSCGHEEQRTLWPCGQSESGSYHGVIPSIGFVKACEKLDRVVARVRSDGFLPISSGMMELHDWKFCEACHLVLQRQAADALAVQQQEKSTK